MPLVLIESFKDLISIVKEIKQDEKIKKNHIKLIIILLESNKNNLKLFLDEILNLFKND